MYNGGGNGIKFTEAPTIALGRSLALKQLAAVSASLGDGGDGGRELDLIIRGRPPLLGCCHAGWRRALALVIGEPPQALSPEPRASADKPSCAEPLVGLVGY